MHFALKNQRRAFRQFSLSLIRFNQNNNNFVAVVAVASVRPRSIITHKYLRAPKIDMEMTLHQPMQSFDLIQLQAHVKKSIKSTFRIFIFNQTPPPSQYIRSI